MYIYNDIKLTDKALAKWWGSKHWSRPLAFYTVLILTSGTYCVSISYSRGVCVTIWILSELYESLSPLSWVSFCPVESYTIMSLCPVDSYTLMGLYHTLVKDCFSPVRGVTCVDVNLAVSLSLS